jgi:hypothetical protein
MLTQDVDREIERLKQKKVELSSKASVLTDFEKKDDIDREISDIQRQIKMMEKFRRK